MQEENLKNYFVNKKYANTTQEVELSPLGGESQSHLNYKALTPTGVLVARVAKEVNLLSFSNLSDEYTLLKLIEKHTVGPRVFAMDLEGFDMPLLLEEYLEGKTFNECEQLPEEVFGTTIKLIARTSAISLTQDEFPFKYTYTTYRTNFRAWEMRIEEIRNAIGDEGVAGLVDVTEKVRTALEPLEKTFHAIKPEFVYNDVHPGNIMLLKTGDVRFIDWQKVSLGDPSFMLALFAKRFGHLWGMDAGAFTERSLKAYQSEKDTPSTFEELFRARILERTVSDAVWTTWANVKKGIKGDPEKQAKYIEETKRLLM